MRTTKSSTTSTGIRSSAISPDGGMRGSWCEPAREAPRHPVARRIARRNARAFRAVLTNPGIAAARVAAVARERGSALRPPRPGPARAHDRGVGGALFVPRVAEIPVLSLFRHRPAVVRPGGGRAAAREALQLDPRPLLARGSFLADPVPGGALLRAGASPGHAAGAPGPGAGAGRDSGVLARPPRDHGRPDPDGIRRALPALPGARLHRALRVPSRGAVHQRPARLVRGLPGRPLRPDTRVRGARPAGQGGRRAPGAGL